MWRPLRQQWVLWCLESVKRLSAKIQNPHNPLHAAVKDTKGYRLGGASLGGSSRGLNTASMQLTELKQTTEWERYPNWFRHLYKTLLPENLRKHCQEWLAGKTVRDQASHWRKQQTARPHSVHWWLSHQRPVRVGLHCQAKCDYHPWRQCSLFGRNLQVQWDVTVRPHVCHHPHTVTVQWACSKKWNGKSWVECVDGQHPPLKTPVGVLPWTCRSGGKWLSR